MTAAPVPAAQCEAWLDGTRCPAPATHHSEGYAVCRAHRHGAATGGFTLGRYRQEDGTWRVGLGERAEIGQEPEGGRCR